MKTMTDERINEIGDVEKIVGGAANGIGTSKPKSDRLRKSTTGEKICDLYPVLMENREMRRDYVEQFMKEHGCYECEGYKNTKCKDRMV